MPQKRTLPTFFLAILLLLAGFIPLSADVIALHPLKGSPEEITYDFYNILIRTLLKAQGSYTAYPIDLLRRSPDVPPGGFPPWICPSAAMTEGAPYAITGETFPDPDFPGEYRLRLYLWEMERRTLLGVDDMIASDRQSCEERLPYFLDWILSWIDTHKEQIKPAERIIEQVPVYIYVDETEHSQQIDTWVSGYGEDTWGEPEFQVESPGEFPGNKWLFLGLRAGGGVSLWYDLIEKNQNPNWPELETNVIFNANAALHVSMNLFRFFQLQAEANLTADFANIEDHRIAEKERFTSLALTVPVLAKILLWGGDMKIGIFGGPYFYFPLFQRGPDLLKDRFEYKPSLPGALFGLSVGWPVGSGFLFLDGRYERDGHWGKELEKGVFYRNVFKLSLGYEFGVFSKKAAF